MNIAERLKIVRGKESRESFAPKIGVHAQTLYRYEQGGRSIDSGVIIAICTKFNVSAAWLLFGDGAMNSAAPQTVCETVPEQGTGTPLKSACTRCMKLEIELEEERVERRSLCAELREVNAENRRLARENRDLSARCATLEERQVKDHAEIQNFEKILNFQCNEVPSKT